jgi:hypothetical protein
MSTQVATIIYFSLPDTLLQNQPKGEYVLLNRICNVYLIEVWLFEIRPICTIVCWVIKLIKDQSRITITPEADGKGKITK